VFGRTARKGNPGMVQMVLNQGLDLMEKSAENVQVNVQTLDSIPTEKQCAILMFGFIKSGSCHSFTE
uniref:Uncharacterized protein n=1 Tax=Haplochromis burtoni TaxID=8153 RepID=A0A3Q2WHW3_HAPBU